MAFAPPLPALNQALWALHLQKKSPKPSGQGLRPPPLRAMPKYLLREFEWGSPNMRYIYNTYDIYNIKKFKTLNVNVCNMDISKV